jgi:hypothetical protein
MYSDHLRALVLSQNPIGNEGAAAVATMLRSGQCQRLQEVAIASCGIGNFGFQTLCEAFEACAGAMPSANTTSAADTSSKEYQTPKLLLALESLGVENNRITNSKLALRLVKTLRLAAPRFGSGDEADVEANLRVGSTLEAATAAATAAAPLPVATNTSLILRRRIQSQALSLGKGGKGVKGAASSLFEIAAEAGRLPAPLLLQMLAQALGLPTERLVLLKKRNVQAVSKGAGSKGGGTSKRSTLVVLVVQVCSDAAVDGAAVVDQLVSLAQSSRHPISHDEPKHSITAAGDSLYATSAAGSTASAVSRLRELGVRWVARAEVVDSGLTPSRTSTPIGTKSRAQRRKQQMEEMNAGRNVFGKSSAGSNGSADAPGAVSLRWRRITVSPPLPFASSLTNRTIIAEGYGEREAEKKAAEKARALQVCRRSLAFGAYTIYTLTL